MITHSRHHFTPQAHTSIAGFAMPERRNHRAFRRRVDVKVDHANTTLLENGNAFLDRALHVCGLGDRAEPDRSLRFRELRNIGRWFGHAQADPTILGLATTGTRDRL